MSMNVCNQLLENTNNLYFIWTLSNILSLWDIISKQFKIKQSTINAFSVLVISYCSRPDMPSLGWLNCSSSHCLNCSSHHCMFWSSYCMLSNSSLRLNSSSYCMFWSNYSHCLNCSSSHCMLCSPSNCGDSRWGCIFSRKCKWTFSLWISLGWSPLHWGGFYRSIWSWPMRQGRLAIRWWSSSWPGALSGHGEGRWHQ